MTGESVPVEKGAEPLPADALLAERSNMLFKGTSVTRGSGAGVVFAIGMATELGRISALVQEADAEPTPLERRLDEFARRLVRLTLALTGLVGITGVVAGRDLLLTIQASIALAVAAVPEGLPVVATLALARGMLRMARRNALVESLSAVETLGSTTLILTDKTGTLTENRMSIVRICVAGPKADPLEVRFPEQAADDGVAVLVRRALTIGALCNDASRGGPRRQEGRIGDPLELALLDGAVQVGLKRDVLADEMPRLREEAFDPAVRMMATFHRSQEGVLVAVKGAPEAVMHACTRVAKADGDDRLDDPSKDAWLALAGRLASQGLRVLAIAERLAATDGAHPYADLTLDGLVGLADPPRRDVRSSVQRCRNAGMRVVMVTGDHADTAKRIAAGAGLDDDGGIVSGRELSDAESEWSEQRDYVRETSVFARITPEQKMDILTLHQNAGEVVAMIGDGVNDAPALKRADIGVAMGKRGTEVAKQASAMVLLDDRFETIVDAIAQGRVIFENIRKFVVYLLSCNLSEILIVGLAVSVNAPLPLLPLQILFLNLVTDVFPALALGVGKGVPGILEFPPRRRAEPIVTGRHWRMIVTYGGLITIAVLVALAVARRVLDMDYPQAVTVSFLTLAFAQLWHVFNMAHERSQVFANEVSRNRMVWGALALCSGLLVAGVYAPGLSDVLSVVDPGMRGWVLILGMSAVPLVVGRLWHALKSRSARSRAADKREAARPAVM